MKYINYNILLVALCFFFMSSCSVEDEVINDNIGYLCLSVSESNEITARAATLPEGYTGKQIAVEIVDTAGVAIEKTEDAREWTNKSIALKAGSYTIKAHSYGFDGKQSAKGAPYYYGSKEITITGGKALNETVICKLANVKMSVKLSDELKESFKTFSVSVAPKSVGVCDPLSFDIDLSKSTISDTLYFPVTDLVVTYAAINKSGKSNSAKWNLSDVKGNYHYILNFTLGTGEGEAQVEVDETLHNFTYTFTVSQKPTNGAEITANAWATCAYLSASDVTATTGTDLTALKFQYRKRGEEEWTEVVASLSDNIYSGKTGVLEPAITYECRLVNTDGSFNTTPITFVTESATTLYNGGFEDWYKKGKIWYASTDADVSSESYLWDSSNPGSGSFGFNPTTRSTDIKHSGSYSAKLETQYAVVKLAAASLYYGRFNELVGTSGAKIDFGQPFASRPTVFKGYYQYSPVAIDYKGGNQPSGTVEKGDMDLCSIFIILSKGTYQVNNTDVSTLLSEQKVKETDQFIAYGELPASECVSTNGAWKEFEIPLKYKNLTEKPTHLIIVCTSSKYGDYFTGGKGSTLYLDDFELIYGEEPVMWN